MDLLNSQFISSVVEGIIVAITAFFLARYFRNRDKDQELHRLYRREITELVRCANLICSKDFLEEEFTKQRNDLDILLLLEIFSVITGENPESLEHSQPIEISINTGQQEVKEQYSKPIRIEDLLSGDSENFKSITLFYFSKIYFNIEKVGINRKTFLSSINKDYHDPIKRFVSFLEEVSLLSKKMEKNIKKNIKLVQSLKKNIKV